MLIESPRGVGIQFEVVGDREEILDFVAVILILGEETGESDDEVFGQFVSVVVHCLLLFSRENFARRPAANWSLARGGLLHCATP